MSDRKDVLAYLLEAYRAAQIDKTEPAAPVEDFVAFAREQLAVLGQPRTNVDRYGLRLVWPQKAIDVYLSRAAIATTAAGGGIAIGMNHESPPRPVKSPAFGVIAREPEKD